MKTSRQFISHFLSVTSKANSDGVLFAVISDRCVAMRTWLLCWIKPVVVSLTQAPSRLDFSTNTAINWWPVYPAVFSMALAQLEIGKLIVQCVTILVMHFFSLTKIATKMFLHHVSMLINVALRVAILVFRHVLACVPEDRFSFGFHATRMPMV